MRIITGTLTTGTLTVAVELSEQYRGAPLGVSTAAGNRKE